jgi:lipopolysaccharide export system ATP-binding protein
MKILQSLFMLKAYFCYHMPITITTKELVKRYGDRTVVNHASIELKQGEIVGLLGPNGAGKTTTFYMVVGLIKPDEGEVYLDDQNITKLAMYKRAQMGIGYLPQEASVFRKLSVEDNISAVLEMTKLSRREQKIKLESLLNEFRLQHVRKSNGDVLSGGERRRTEIARALAVDPKFILLDEPFAGIDPIAVEDIQAIVARLKYKNIGILITDHNVTETLSICDRAYLLIEGKIFQHGTAEELAANDQVRKLYLGRNFELRRKDYLHEEARGEARSDFPRESIKQIQDYIDLADELAELTGPAMDEKIVASQFFAISGDIIKKVREFSREKELPQLGEYADQVEGLRLKDKMYASASFMDLVHHTEKSIGRFHNEGEFRAALRQSRDLMEKIKKTILGSGVAKILPQ